MDMIIFEKEQLTIVIKDADIAGRWVNMVDELLDLLYCKNEDFIRQHQKCSIITSGTYAGLGANESDDGYKARGRRVILNNGENFLRYFIE